MHLEELLKNFGSFSFTLCAFFIQQWLVHAFGGAAEGFRQLLFCVVCIFFYSTMAVHAFGGSKGSSLNMVLGMIGSVLYGFLLHYFVENKF